MGSGVSSSIFKRKLVNHSHDKIQEEVTNINNEDHIAATNRPYVCPLPLDSALGVSVTPRSEAEWKKLSIPYTPVGNEAEVFKYYCPLCMLFFKEIMKSSCCGNYICLDCFNDYLHSKGIDEGSTVNTDDMLRNVILEDITCPHCLHYGFQPQYVSHLEIVRDYSRSMPLLHMENIANSNKINAPLPSPLRVGESFEDLKRKMIPFKVQSNLGVILRSDDHSTHTHSLSVHPSPENSETVIDDGNNAALFDRDDHFKNRSRHDSPRNASPAAVDEGYAMVTSFSPSSSGKVHLFQPVMLFDQGSLTSRMAVDAVINSAVDNIQNVSAKLSLVALENCNSPDSDVLSEASPVVAHDNNSYGFDHELSAFSLDLEESLPVMCSNYAHCLVDSIFQTVVMRET